MHNNIQVELVPGGTLPTKGDPQAAGYDLYARIDSEITLSPGERVIVPVGIKTFMPIGWRGRICDRSGLAAKQGIHTLAGLIDSSFRNEWQVVLINLSRPSYSLDEGCEDGCCLPEIWEDSEQNFKIKPNMRIAQVCFERVDEVSLELVPSISIEGDRGGGFGSTGS
jgi:dUTP pyrophosphatase